MIIFYFSIYLLETICCRLYKSKHVIIKVSMLSGGRDRI